MTMDIPDSIRLVIKERGRQDEKWGARRSLPNRTWLAILVEELGEVAKADLEQESTKRLIQEIVQVAAVAVAWIDDLHHTTF